MTAELRRWVWMGALLLFLLSPPLFGAEDTLRLKFNRYSVDLGLPDHTVSSILQDNLGFIWLGTTDGFFRYDGRTFYGYRHSIHAPDSLSNNFVEVIYQAGDGTIWAGTDLGLNALKPDFSGFSHYFHDEARTGSLVNDSITALFEDRKGRFWIGTRAGLDRLDRTTGDFKHYGYRDDQGRDVVNRRISFIFEDGEGRLWVGGSDGLSLYDEAQDRFERYLVVGTGDRSIGSALSAYYDKANRSIWFGTSLGLISLEPTSGRAEIFEPQQTPAAGPPNFVMTIEEDHAGRLWLGSFNEGLAIFDRKKRVFHHQTRVLGDPTTLPVDEIRRVFKDAGGLMWVGTTGGGIGFWNPSARVFRHYTRIPGKEGSLNHEVPWHFMETEDNVLWIATDGGLNRWQFGSETFHNVVHDPQRKDSIGPGAVWYLAKTRDHRLWLCQANGLDLFDPKTETAVHFPMDGENPKALPNGSYYSALAAQDEVVWLAAGTGGLVLFDADLGLLKQYRSDPDREDWLDANEVLYVASARDGHLWLGTSNGMFHFDQEKEQFTHYPENRDGSGLSNRRVFRLYQDERGTVWVATGGGGLNRMDGKGRFTYYTTREGLPSDNILTVGADRSGFIWLSTVRGLCRFDPRTESVRNFDVSHGLQSNEFNDGSYYRDRSGRLYFGGGNGFNVFNPDEITVSHFVPPVHFTNIASLNKPITIPTRVPHISELTLSWRETILSFSFASLDYTSPRRNRYMYQMDGLNDIWVDNGNANTVSFTNLQPGHYALRVKGANSDGRWNETPVTIAVHIETPPWLRPTSIVGYILVVMLVIGLYLRAQSKRRMVRRAQHAAIRRSEERLKHALWGTGDELWDWDIVSDKVHRSNMLAVRGDGVAYEALEGIYEQMHPDDVAAVQQSLDDHLGGESEYYEAYYRLRAADGKWVWVLDRGRIVERDKDGKPLRMAGTNKDITDMKQTEMDLELIAKAFANTSDGVVITDPAFAIIATNPAYTTITGNTLSEVLGKPFLIEAEARGHQMQDELVREALTARGHWSGELWQEHRKGGRFPVSANVDGVVDQRGQTTHFVFVFSDITFERQAEERMQELANYDQLTSLPNRNLFGDRLVHALSLAQREKHAVALLFLDLDRFKNINDSLGHAAGDLLLQEVALRVRSALREVDSVARLGGDEFTVILEGHNDLADIAAVAGKILSSLEGAFVINGQSIVVTPSIGVSVFPEDGDNAETLLQCADTAMYHAKGLGGNNFQFFTPQMNHLVVERLNLENELRQALEREEFVVYYQPKFRTNEGTVSGLEALVRWIHPEEGMVSPAKFIPVAEETGLIVPLGLWVLQQACKDAAKWQADGLDGGHVAVNLSALQFRQKDLVDAVAKILEDTGLPAYCLELEITESTLLNDMDHAVAILMQFRELGITLALDDFGTGFSSLGYLKKLPIHKLKIDRSFVNDVTRDPEDASIVTSIIDLAHNLNITVVAEGVETDDQLRFLQERNCDMVQGFLFAKPLPLEEATRMLSIQAHLRDAPDKKPPS